MNRMPLKGGGAFIGRLFVRSLIVLTAVFLVAFWAVFFSPRPPLTTDPATLEGDGGTTNHCELPVLDGSGKLAADIPKGNTPGCSYTHFPLPILAECTEPLIEGADDIRGLWLVWRARMSAIWNALSSAGGAWW